MADQGEVSDNRLFQDESDEEEFEGFRAEEIEAYRRTMITYDSDEENGNPAMFVHDNENQDPGNDENAHRVQTFHDWQEREWAPCDHGAPVIRAQNVPLLARERLLPARVGVRYDTEMDAFNVFFSDEMIECMVIETNRYAAQWKARPNLPRYARIHRWVDTDANEMRAFIALRIAMGLTKKNTASDYFTSTSFWLTQTPNFKRVMSQHRFEALVSCLHFVNNEERVGVDQDGYDPLFKLRPLIDIVVRNWRTAVTPCRHLSIDESMMPFRGRVQFRQYIKSKHHRYGVKAFALCDAATSYCIKYDIYTGRFYAYNRDLGQGCSVVLDLAQGMPEGAIFYTDSFYTSPTLALELMQMKMGLVGTAQRNRRGMPEELRERPQFDPKFVFKDPILAVAFKDRNDVRMLSTIHGTEVQVRQHEATRRERETGVANADGHIVREIPVLTHAYNQKMRGVDGLDQLCSYNPYPFRTRKWYIKVFNYILEISLINARILLGLANGTNPAKKCFREHLIDQLLQRYLQANNIEIPRGAEAGRQPRRRALQPDNLGRLEGQHFIRSMPENRRACKACKRDGRTPRVNTTWICSTCPDHPHLCVEPCFERYHTLEDFHFLRPPKQARREAPAAEPAPQPNVEEPLAQADENEQ